MKWDLAIAAVTIAGAILLVASAALAIDTPPPSVWETEIALNTGSLDR